MENPNSFGGKSIDIAWQKQSFCYAISKLLPTKSIAFTAENENSGCPLALRPIIIGTFFDK